MISEKEILIIRLVLAPFPLEPKVHEIPTILPLDGKPRFGINTALTTEPDLLVGSFNPVTS